MIDTHCHLYLQHFHDDLEEAEARALAEGVQKILLPNVDLASVENLRGLLKSRPELYRGMMGLHPCSVKEDWKEVLPQIESEFRSHHSDYLAVGEIGLDLHWDKSTLNWQMEALGLQFQWAIADDLPVSIHCREAFDPLFELLSDFSGKGLKGALHCFTGTAEQAERCLEFGLHLGIGGVVTYKNGGLDNSLKAVPADRLLLETDAPYLSPVPFRGKRNEPSYLTYIAARTAFIMGMEEEELRDCTTDNARKLFDL